MARGRCARLGAESRWDSPPLIRKGVRLSGGQLIAAARAVAQEVAAFTGRGFIDRETSVGLQPVVPWRRSHVLDSARQLTGDRTVVRES